MGARREKPARAPRLPAGLAEMVDGYRWRRDTVGEAGAAVYRLHAAGRPTLYLKRGRGAGARDVADEAARMAWLGRHIDVPQVVHFTATPGAVWLLMGAVPGRTAHQVLEAEPERRPETVAAIAAWLRRLHALPVETCPFNSAHPLRLAHAWDRMQAGEVDESDFCDEHFGWPAERVWERMTGLLPLAPDPVVTHGDFSLDNILLADGRVTGCIDLGRVGVADRYQDLAILWSCLGEFDASLGERLFATYGVDTPDRRKIAFHLCLDEFF